MRPCLNDHSDSAHLKGVPFEQGSMCKLCWYWENSPIHREIWSKQPLLPPPKPKIIDEFVGDYLAESFEWFGQVKSGGCCACITLQESMNEMGVAGCRKHYDWILSKLQENAFARNLPITRDMFRPLLSAAIWRAERRAKALAKSEENRQNDAGGVQ